MSERNRYKTVAHEAQAIIIEKKSKFIANVKPADNEADALAFLSRIRSAYPDASHNVYAYAVAENNIFRYSDDGEPSGTAGMPVLNAIRNAGLTDVAVVVTRYFGGTLLGTGGLTHTYGAAAREGIAAAKEIIREKCRIISAKVDYSLVGKMQYMLAKGGFGTEDTLYGSDVEFIVSCPINDTERLMAQLTELTGGKAACAVIAEKYIDREA